MIGRRFHAVGATTEIHRVQIAVQDPTLGLGALQLYGQARFADLAIELLRTGEQIGFDELLGDGGTSLLNSTRRQIGQHGTTGRAQIEPLVTIEISVFDVKDGLNQLFWDPSKGHGLAVFRAFEHGDLTAVAVRHNGALVERTEITQCRRLEHGRFSYPRQRPQQQCQTSSNSHRPGRHAHGQPHHTHYKTRQAP